LFSKVRARHTNVALAENLLRGSVHGVRGFAATVTGRTAMELQPCGEPMIKSRSRFTRHALAISCSALFVLTASSRADATTIGTFFYDADFFGPTFLVENTSDSTLPVGGAFSNVNVQLFLDGDPVDGPISILMFDLPFAGLGPNYQQGSTTDVIDPASFDSAVLSVQFSLLGTISASGR
jgi:hypothetical protein